MFRIVDFAAQQAARFWNECQPELDWFVPNYEKLDGHLQYIETKIANRAGYIPGLSIFTGLARQKLGLAQIIAGIALAAFHRIFGHLSSDKEVREKFYKASIIDFTYSVNGCGNFVRGQLEQMSLIIPLISSLAFFAYDQKLRLNYKSEKNSGVSNLLLNVEDFFHERLGFGSKS